MNTHPSFSAKAQNLKLSLFSTGLLILFLLNPAPGNLRAQEPGPSITIHLRGVYDSKISLLGMSGTRLFKPVAELASVPGGGTGKLVVPPGQAPGEFVLRFDYREKESSTPYPSEKHIFINRQDLELWVSPMYCNNSDSTWFQAGEIENTAFSAFSKENGGKKEQLGVLQGFLMSYDDTGSKFYQQGIAEWEKRRKEYNGWLKERKKQDQELFVSNLYNFQYVPEISMTGSEGDRVKSLIAHYFDDMDFNDPLLIRTADINKWMDGYVNLYGQMATTAALRDSLLSAAGRNAIEASKKGDPLVYGWMVDYFFRGYEANGIEAGMKVLQPYLDDPRCLTSKRQEIERRLKGMETLVPGSSAPDFSLEDPSGGTFVFSSYKPGKPYILVLFWSADCSHCMETTSVLQPWLNEAPQSEKVAVVAVSLDETETEIGAWEKKRSDYPGWKHLRAKEGVRSQVASDYYLLSTPVMVLVDAATRKVVAVPGTVAELKKALP